jgi:hypothetical protein
LSAASVDDGRKTDHCPESQYFADDVSGISRIKDAHTLARVIASSSRLGAGQLARHPFAGPVRLPEDDCQIYPLGKVMLTAIPNSTNVWMTVPASPPLRLTIRDRLDGQCEECRLPVYRCESEAGQMLSLCADHLQLRHNRKQSAGV